MRSRLPIGELCGGGGHGGVRQALRQRCIAAALPAGAHALLSPFPTYTCHAAQWNLPLCVEEAQRLSILLQCALSWLSAHVHTRDDLHPDPVHQRNPSLLQTEACALPHMCCSGLHACTRGEDIFAAHRRKLRLLPARSSLCASAGGMKGGRSVSSRRYPLRHSAPAPSVARPTQHVRLGAITCGCLFCCSPCAREGASVRAACCFCDSVRASVSEVILGAQTLLCSMAQAP